MTMIVQLINLDRSQARLETMRRQLDTLGIAYERLPATDGRNLTSRDRAYYSPLRCRLYYGRRLKDNEIGCYRSHMRALERFLASDAETTLILEDDAVLPDDFSQVVQSVLTHLERPENHDWEIVNLGNAPKNDFHYIALTEVPGNHTLVRTRVFPKRNTAMLWSRKGAEHFLAEGLIIRAPIDQHLHSSLSARRTGFSVMPAPMPHSGVESEIDADAPDVRKRDGRSFWYRWRGHRRKLAARREADRLRRRAKRAARR